MYSIFHTFVRLEWGTRVVEHLIRLVYLARVEEALGNLSEYLRVGLVGDVVCIATDFQHKNAKEVVELLRIGLEQNEMGLFTHFMESNENLFSLAQIERL